MSVLGQSAAGIYAGAIVGRTYAEYTSNGLLTGTIPLDDTIPQNTEGDAILAASITPKSTTNRLRITVTGYAALAAINNLVVTINNGAANCLHAETVTVPGADYRVPIAMVFEYVPGVTTSETITIRSGTSGGGNYRWNGNSVSRYFGGISRVTLVIEEIRA